MIDIEPEKLKKLVYETNYNNNKVKFIKNLAQYI